MKKKQEIKYFDGNDFEKMYNFNMLKKEEQTEIKIKEEIIKDFKSIDNTKNISLDSEKILSNIKKEIIKKQNARTLFISIVNKINNFFTSISMRKEIYATTGLISAIMLFLTIILGNIQNKEGHNNNIKIRLSSYEKRLVLNNKVMFDIKKKNFKSNSKKIEFKYY